MLIQCGKCGKMYDYDKYSGICPKCARYNRLDSREDMEQNMHDRYDTGSHPHQHDWYQEPKNTYKHSPKSYAHEEEKRETGWKSADRSDNSKIRKHMGVKIFVLEQLSTLTAEPGYVYYLISINIKNNLPETYNLSYLTADLISFWSDEDMDGNPDTYYPVEKLFTISQPETESMDNNYIDVLVAVPEELEDLYGACTLNDNTEEFDCYLYQD